jgi:DNA-binding beta-propeller fold protein YncE
LTPRLVTVDSATGEAISSLSLFSCFRPTDVTVAPDGTRVYVSCDNSQGPASGRIVVVDPATKQVLEELVLSRRPLAPLPSHRMALVSWQREHNTVRVFDRISLTPIVDVLQARRQNRGGTRQRRAYISSPGTRSAL